MINIVAERWNGIARWSELNWYSPDPAFGTWCRASSSPASLHRTRTMPDPNHSAGSSSTKAEHSVMFIEKKRSCLCDRLPWIAVASRFSVQMCCSTPHSLRAYVTTRCIVLHRQRTEVTLDCGGWCSSGAALYDRHGGNVCSARGAGGDSLASARSLTSFVERGGPSPPTHTHPIIWGFTTEGNIFDASQTT